MDKPFFSVIVPAYNSEAYIRRGLDSIRDQAFKDYELIIVCDSCTDNTAAVAREYTDKVYEVNYNHDGLTRNVGLEKATGQWILFMDDDDWYLHEYVFAQLAAIIRNVEADIVCFSFIMRGCGYCMHSQKQIWPAVWSKAWKRSIIGDRRFSDVKSISDLGFTTEVCKDAIMAFWDMPMYYYNYMREGSISQIEASEKDK